MDYPMELLASGSVKYRNNLFPISNCKSITSAKYGIHFEGSIQSSLHDAIKTPHNQVASTRMLAILVALTSP